MPRPVDAPRPSWRHARPALARASLALALAVGFLWAASRIDPGQSSAVTTLAPTDGVHPEPARRSIGALEGFDHTLVVVATPEGPRYTIYDAAGAVIAQRVTREELSSLRPDLNLDSLIAGPLMLAPDDR